MRSLAVLTVSTALVVALNAPAVAGKTCIDSATSALPKLSGLVVKRSRTRPVSQAIMATWRGQAKPVIIDVEIETQGDVQVYSYMCVVTQGSAFVQRTMN